jgi:hypothetical protein
MAAVLVALCLALTSVAKADTLLYNNGAINGMVEAYTINFGFQVSDSFTLSVSTSGLTRITGVGLWLFPGDTPTGIGWQIGSSFFGSDISSGFSSIATNTFQFMNTFGYDVYTSSLLISTPGLGPGTYYLTLDNATTAQGNPLYWDQNSGPSSAMDSSLGSIPSESFQVYGGTVTQTPEPASLLLLGSGLLGLAGGIRKRMKG